MSSVKRKAIPTKLKRELYFETAGRCAMPNCRESSGLEIAHIIPHAMGGKDNFENLLVLCAVCHKKCDQEKNLCRNSMKKAKHNLMILNGRYGHFEMRILDFFSENHDQNSIQLFGRELDVMYLLKDGLIEECKEKSSNAINFPPKTYYITKNGIDFINHWKNVDMLDEIN